VNIAIQRAEIERLDAGVIEDARARQARRRAIRFALLSALAAIALIAYFAGGGGPASPGSHVRDSSPLGAAREYRGQHAAAALTDLGSDPASYVLVTHRYFLPEDADASAQQQRHLGALLNAAAEAGLPIRVAVIPSEFDLGSVAPLWGRPRIYARYLAVELANSFNSALLVVMPNGLGLNWPGHSTPATNHKLAAIKIAPGSAGLLSATNAGVRALTAADDIKPPAH